MAEQLPEPIKLNALPVKDDGAPLETAPGEFLVNNDNTGEPEVWDSAEVQQNKRFNDAVAAAPRAVWTLVLIAINMTVYLLMVARGVSPMEPTVPALLQWGADFAPLVTHGEWWRMFTSMFLHIGFVHLAMNMVILFGIGMFLEKVFGRVGFLVLYVLSGIGGSLVSLAWHPLTVSAGASGAIFGLYGGLFGFLLAQRNVIPRHRVAAMAKSAAIFVGYNVLYGLSKQGVDMGAHAGGFVSGFLLGAALALPLPFEAGQRMRRNLIVLTAGVVVAAGAAMRLPVIDDLQTEIARFGPIESQCLKVFDDSLDQLKAHKITEQQFAKIMDEQVLPPWNEEKERIAKLKTVEDQAGLAQQLMLYFSQRAEGWTLLEKGVLTDNADLVLQANAKQKAADEAIAGLGKGK